MFVELAADAVWGGLAGPGLGLGHAGVLVVVAGGQRLHPAQPLPKLCRPGPDPPSLRWRRRLISNNFYL